MDAFAATSKEITGYSEKQVYLKPYAGPQCFAHLTPRGLAIA